MAKAICITYVIHMGFKNWALLINSEVYSV